MSSSGVHSRHRDVRGVANDMRRMDAGSHNTLGQGRGVRRDIKSRQAADDCEPLLYLCGVADRSFADNHLRNPALKLAMPIRPPFLGDLLVAGTNQVAAGTSDQIANKMLIPAIPIPCWFLRGADSGICCGRTACMPAARQA